ncbi:MoxR family ATPase [Actinoplanes sichuanensis]|uniref:AAA family ATPase n=1 Tax=Actinoplanes sichuanensis TaxID=512349 RepID=A0ABW4APD7_9ACTN|nr:MoxR family ATPase [Actinoplanes sichuanensis]BEL06256.1 MoxR family ATPase [Actinoplanes sichuanensis]
MTADPTWWIYHGAGAQHDRISQLPPPPPWRRFDGEVLQPGAAPDGFAAEPRPGAEERARNYRPDRAVIDMVNAALFLRRPLLVTGKPGTGKSTLALSIAWELRLGSVLHWPITSRAQLQQSLYRYDAVGRLQEANLRRLGQDGPPVTSAAPFITLGPLGTALLARDRPRVLLIDEFDKSDIDLPNDLLNVLEEGQFAIPELTREEIDEPVSLITHDGASALVRGGHIRANAFPIIIITSNGERAFPDAFKRRCLQITISDPDEDRLSEIVRSQLGDEALERSTELFRSFVGRRDRGASVTTDQLLNAVFLATSGLTEDSETRRNLAMALLRSGEAGDL